MNTTWIKRSEREPVDADFPIVGGAYINRGSKPWWDQGFYADHANVPAWFTHWRSIKADPPPRELTQREADWALAKAVTQNWYKVEGGSEELALLAIYAERREVAKIAADTLGDDWGIDSVGRSWAGVWKQLRARLDEQGAK